MHSSSVRTPNTFVVRCVGGAILGSIVFFFSSALATTPNQTGVSASSVGAAARVPLWHEGCTTHADARKRRLAQRGAL